MIKNICIIPARKGSKRIKNKNIINFFGKPIIYYSIIAAKKSKLFKDIYLSTDSKKIKKIAEKFKVICNNLRNKKLSSDNAKTFDVIKDFTNNLEFTPEIICCLYPASPFIKPSHLKRAHNILKKNKNIDLIIPVAEFSNNPLRSLAIKKKLISPLNNSQFNNNSNKLEKVYYDTGSFYMIRSSFINKSKSFFPSKAYPLIIKKNEFVDINDREDLRLAEKLF